MSDRLEFDEAEARLEEAIYETSAAVERRRLVRDALDVEKGESVLSVGCEPGFEPAELARAVGADGFALGIDRSEAMLEIVADVNRRQSSTSIAEDGRALAKVPRLVKRFSTNILNRSR